MSFEQKGVPAGVNKFGVTGAGNSAEVFGVVCNTVLKMVDRIDPISIGFSAAHESATAVATKIGRKAKEGGSRVSLYKAIIRRLIKSRKWKLETITDPDPYAFKPETEFRLTRISD